MPSELVVTHFVLVRQGRPVATGERLATWALPPELVGGIPRAAWDRTVELQRQQWARVVVQAGYTEGWAVVVHRERGFRRSIFPAAALPGLAPAPAIAAVTPPGGPRQ